MRGRASERGQVLILVLALIVLVTAAGAALYSASATQRAALGAVKNQATAAARAYMGALHGVGQLRRGTISITAAHPTLTCQPEWFGCNPGLGSQVFGSHTQDEDGDGVPEYTFVVYTRVTPNFAQPVLVVDSVGFSGDVDNPNAATARVEVEMQIPQTLAQDMGNVYAGGGGD